MPAEYDIIPYGDSAFLVQFHTDRYNESVTDHIHALIGILQKKDCWEEVVPGYNSLLAYFCPDKFKPQDARQALLKALKKPAKANKTPDNIVEIPVCYGGEFGPDMQTIMDSSGLSEAGVVELHSAQTYKVCMMGFVPGFTFLSEAPKVLHHARRNTPRAIVPAGSVGIAGWQTGIYGLESPGGWQLIGRTPLKMFERKREAPFLVQAGAHVRFVSIAPKRFWDLS